MSFGQKVGRSIFFSATLVVGSVLVAMLGALGLFIIEKGREMGSTPELLKGLAIIAVGIAINTTCVFVLLHIKRADHKLLSPPKE